MKRTRAELLKSLDTWMRWLESQGLAKDDAFMDYAIEQHMLGLPPPTNVEAWKDNARRAVRAA